MTSWNKIKASQCRHLLLTADSLLLVSLFLLLALWLAVVVVGLALAIAE